MDRSSWPERPFVTAEMIEAGMRRGRRERAKMFASVLRAIVSLFMGGRRTRTKPQDGALSRRPRLVVARPDCTKPSPRRELRGAGLALRSEGPFAEERMPGSRCAEAGDRVRYPHLTAVAGRRPADRPKVP